MQKRVGNWKRNHTRQVTKDEMREYGSFIRQMRESIGLNKTQFGRELGVNQASIRRWENAETIPQRELDDIVDDVRGVVKKYRSRVS